MLQEKLIRWRVWHEAIQNRELTKWSNRARPVNVRGLYQMKRDEMLKLSGAILKRCLELCDSKAVTMEAAYQKALLRGNLFQKTIDKKQLNIAGVFEHGLFFNLCLEAGDRTAAMAVVEMNKDIRHIHDGNAYVMTIIEPLERKVQEHVTSLEKFCRNNTVPLGPVCVKRLRLFIETHRPVIVQAIESDKNCRFKYSRLNAGKPEFLPPHLKK